MGSVDWGQAWSIVGRGIGLVFFIMCLLAGLTWLMGKIINRIEAARPIQGEGKK